MNDVELVNACLRITEAANQRRKDRQDYEWRFTVALWSLMVIAIYYSQKEVLLPWFWVRWTAAAFFAALYFGFWLLGIHMGHYADRVLGTHYLEKAKAILANHGIPPITPSYGWPPRCWGALFQLSVTVLLLIFFVIVGPN